MSFLGSLARGYVINRLLRGGRRHRRHHRLGRGAPYGYGSRTPYAYGRRTPYGYGGRRRSGGGIFPIPHYSRRTRGGGRVTVGGCCLPIPLGVLAAGAVASRRLRA